jgi:hypothetical protein
MQGAKDVFGLCLHSLKVCCCAPCCWDSDSRLLTTVLVRCLRTFLGAILFANQCAAVRLCMPASLWGVGSTREGGAPHVFCCLAARHPRPPPPHLATLPQTEFKKTGTSKPDFQVITGSIYALDHVLNSFCDVLQEASAADSAALYKCDCAPTKPPSALRLYPRAGFQQNVSI